MQPGDVAEIYADTTLLARDFGLKPRTSLEVGLGKFVDEPHLLRSHELSAGFIVPPGLLRLTAQKSLAY